MDNEKRNQAIQLLNESGYNYLLFDLEDVIERADTLDVTISNKEANEIVEKVLNAGDIYTSLNNEIDEFL
jgi:DNA replicative helicase MCM subunit Mcm2 (Cdc46/Mcm family)